jgi:hypothetical protein
MNYQQIQDAAPEGLEAIIRTAKGERHRDYGRSVQLAADYHAFISGDGIEKYLKRVVRRENDMEFQQRVDLTVAITPSVCSRLMSLPYKVPRVNNITDIIDFEDDTNAKAKREKIDTAIREYYGDETLDSYMAGRYIELSFVDPNAFIVTEFMDGERDQMGNLTGPVKPYPIEYLSEQCVNYCYENNVLQWMVTACKHDVKVGDKTTEGTRYVIYLPVYAISLDPVDAKLYQAIPVGEQREYPINDEMVPVLRTGDNDAFIVRLYEHKSKITPAKRVGYKRDLVTKGRTCVSPLEPAMPYLRKSLKSVSEMDISMSLHAFHQKIATVPRCTSHCIEGMNKEGTGKCETCGGTGHMPLHTSAQDAITIPMPRDPKDIIDLSKMVYYPQLQVDLLRFQDEYIKELTEECKRAMYNSDIYSKTEVTTTATQQNIDKDAIYDTLAPFATQYAAVRTYQVKVSAYYIDIPDIIVIYKFPKDFQFRTRDELLDELAKASSSNAPGYVKQAISDELTGVMFKDKPDELKRIRVKEKFQPFSDKTTAEVMLILNNEMSDERTEVLWVYFNTIFINIEQEVAAENLKDEEGNAIYLYDMSFESISKRVDKQIDSYIALKAPKEPATVLPAVPAE